MSRLPLKYVHAFRDRHGHLRHYFRKGARRIPLPGLVGSEGFMAAYQAALAGDAKPEIGADRTKPGTVRNGRIRIERAKGSREVDIPLTPELAAAIDAMRKVHLTFIVSQWGKPYTADALGKLFGRWATEAGLPKRCRLHGLKKGGMRRLAESGGTAHELMAISGHKTLAEVQRYTEEADRKKLADSGTRKRTENAELANLGAPKWQTGS
jgi:hypothetical protein